ncbi:DUF167 domain-containing protein [Acidithiobacillus montserratensis]|uniref:DUF167 domain-containing protein n=1 Tax=Acidithiobacillus montserratensis TaxID=2729135 RepID=UPI001C060D52|nr:DUF167 domain-containing protein [Acidithiobacillaceae bacterium]MBU2748370.1 DUF167 domain-containing protein [Acidithiobacillus montserratensis]
MAVFTLQVKVKPRSKRSAFIQQSDGSWIAQLKSPPVDGKANAELLHLQQSNCYNLMIAGAAQYLKAATNGDKNDHDSKHDEHRNSRKSSRTCPGGWQAPCRGSDSGRGSRPAPRPS